MLVTPGGKEYPINWCGARCGLGLGDLEFLDRYGLAMGYRVRRSASWSGSDPYVDVDGRLLEGAPNVGEWYLLPEDLPEEPMSREVGTKVSDELVEAALQERRDYPIPEDLRPEPTPSVGEQRELRFMATEQVQRKREQEVLDRFEITGSLEEWLQLDQEKVSKGIRVLEAIEQEAPETHAEIVSVSGVPQSSVSRYMNGFLEACVDGDGEVYELQPVGHKALSVRWGEVFNTLRGDE